MNLRLLIILTILSAAGCNTFEKRSIEKEAVYSQLDAATQDKLRRGIVEIGFTQDMVFIALGEPDSRTEKITASSREEIWIYLSYYTEYRGTQTVGYRRFIDYNPHTQKHYVYYQPARVDIYRNHIEDRIRIIFREGKAAEIEQVK